MAWFGSWLGSMVGSSIWRPKTAGVDSLIARDHLVDDRHEVERDRLVVAGEVLRLVLQDEDRLVMGAGHDLPPEGLERVALEELEHLAPDEVLHGAGEGGGEHLRSLRERVGDDLLRVDGLGQLIGEVRGQLALDLWLLADRDDDALEVVAVEDLVLAPDAHRRQQQEQAREHHEQSDAPTAEAPTGFGGSWASGGGPSSARAGSAGIASGVDPTSAVDAAVLLPLDDAPRSVRGRGCRGRRRVASAVGPGSAAVAPTSAGVASAAAGRRRRAG